MLSKLIHIFSCLVTTSSKTHDTCNPHCVSNGARYPIHTCPSRWLRRWERIIFECVSLRHSFTIHAKMMGMLLWRSEAYKVESWKGKKEPMPLVETMHKRQFFIISVTLNLKSWRKYESISVTRRLKLPATPITGLLGNPPMTHKRPEMCKVCQFYDVITYMKVHVYICTRCCICLSQQLQTGI